MADDDVLSVSVYVVCELKAGVEAAGAPGGEGERLCEALVRRNTRHFSKVPGLTLEKY